MKPFRRRQGLLSLFSSVLVFQSTVAAISLDLSSPASIKNASKIIADNMMSYYTGWQPGNVAGNLPAPYYWWEAGAMFGALIDYWYFTGDDSYNNWTMAALLNQASPTADFMPPNQTKTEGNDDQSFWAMAAMSAAEVNFPNPPNGQPGWLALAQAVFNLQAGRWDPTSCGGGLRWQIYPFNGGYNYKNSISNGCFFNIASRLAVYTNNDTYSQWAEKAYDWVTTVGLMDSNYNIWDGSDDTINCTQFDHHQWTYNSGTFLLGAANMYNYTNGSAIWKQRIEGIIGGINIFLKNDIMFELDCEPAGNCDTDQKSFKAYLARWMAAAMVRAPFTVPLLKPILQTSAMAAAKICTGGTDGNACGMRWYTGSFDGSMGVGEQMSALEVIQSNLITEVAAPVTNTTGGTSQGNSNAGAIAPLVPSELLTTPMTTADRAGAAVMTLGVVVFFIGGCWWLVL